MATTTSSTSYAAVATQIVAIAAQTDEQKLLDEAIQDVLQRCKKSKVSRQTLEAFKASRTSEEFLATFDRLRSNNKLLKSIEKGSLLDKVTRFVDFTIKFKSLGKALTQINQTIAAPVWGVLCAALVSIQNIRKTGDSLDQLGDRLGNWVKRFSRLYSSAGGISNDVRVALLAFHKIAIEFSFGIAVVFESAAFKTLYDTLSSNILDRLTKFSQKIHDAASDVDNGVLYDVHNNIGNLTQSQAFFNGSPLPSSTSPQSKHNYPNMLSPCFVGRRQVLRAIQNSLNAVCPGASPSIAAIHGLAGVGKSQTALRFVHNCTNKHPYIFFTRATDKATVLAEFRGIAKSLDLLRDKQLAEKYNDDVMAILQQWFKSNSGWLLVLDNVTDSHDVLGILPTEGSGQILITTRSEIVAEFLAPKDNIIEIKPMDIEEEGVPLALSLARIPEPPATRDVDSARSIATFACGLPLVIEQIVNLGRYMGIGWDGALNDIDKKKMEWLKQNPRCSYHENQLSAWATVETVLTHLDRQSPKSAELFRILVFFDPSSISIDMMCDATHKLNSWLERKLTYDRGTRDSTTRERRAREQARKPRQRINMLDVDPFSTELFRWVFRRGEFSMKALETSLPRVDSSSDIEMQELWRSSEKLMQNVFENSANLDNAINVLRDVGVIKKLSHTHIWIHDLFAEMGQASVEQMSPQRGRNTAHLAATMVYLNFPFPKFHGIDNTVEQCVASLPHAVTCQNHLKKFSILNDTTIGPELSHLIASSIGMARHAYSKSGGVTITKAKAIEYYQDAFEGYFDAWKRLDAAGISAVQIRLSICEDWLWEERTGYTPSRYLIDHERFGNSAPWRCASTLTKLGAMLSEEGRYAEAISKLRTATRLSGYIFDDSHIDTLTTNSLLMAAYMRQGDFLEAYRVACKKAGAFMEPSRWVIDPGDDPKPVRLGLRDTSSGVNMAYDIGCCALEIPGLEYRAIEMFENMLAGQEYVHGKGSGLCCPPKQLLAKACEKMGKLHDAVIWQGQALELAIADSSKDGAGDVENVDEFGDANSTIARSVKGTRTVRWLSDSVVQEVIAQFRILSNKLDDADESLKISIGGWERMAEIWEITYL